MSDREECASAMFDILAAAPEPISRDEIMALLSIQGVSEFHKTKGVLQDMLGSDDEINLVGEHANGNGWFYSLRGAPDDEIARRYLIQKERNILGREIREYFVVCSLARNVDKRTTAGRLAYRVVKQAYRKIEDSSDLLVELGYDGDITLPPPPNGKL
jgi:hypothetical protein